VTVHRLRTIHGDSLLTNGTHRGDMQPVWDILGLPEQHCFPLIALILGYPAKEPAYMKGRLSGPQESGLGTRLPSAARARRQASRQPPGAETRKPGCTRPSARW